MVYFAYTFLFSLCLSLSLCTCEFFFSLNFGWTGIKVLNVTTSEGFLSRISHRYIIPVETAFANNTEHRKVYFFDHRSIPPNFGCNSFFFHRLAIQNRNKRALTLWTCGDTTGLSVKKGRESGRAPCTPLLPGATWSGRSPRSSAASTASP